MTSLTWGWDDRDPKDVKQIVRRMVSEICLEAAAERAQKNMTSLGVKAITACDPHTRPEKTKRKPAPDFHAAKEDVLIEMRTEYREFAKAYRRAKRRLGCGQTEVALDSFVRLS